MIDSVAYLSTIISTILPTAQKKNMSSQWTWLAKKWSKYTSQEESKSESVWKSLGKGLHTSWGQWRGFLSR